MEKNTGTLILHKKRKKMMYLMEFLEKMLQDDATKRNLLAQQPTLLRDVCAVEDYERQQKTYAAKGVRSVSYRALCDVCAWYRIDPKTFNRFRKEVEALISPLREH